MPPYICLSWIFVVKLWINSSAYISWYCRIYRWTRITGWSGPLAYNLITDCLVSRLILFSCFSVLLALRLPRLGRERLFGFVCFPFLLVSGKGCGLWLWHSLDISLTIFDFIHMYCPQRENLYLQSGQGACLSEEAWNHWLSTDCSAKTLVRTWKLIWVFAIGIISR